jgi:transposase
LTHTEYTDPVPVRRAYKFRAYPTRPQEGRAVRLLADHCDLYNAALEERREAWRVRKVSISYGMQSAQLRDIRRADPDGQGRHSFSAQQQTLRRLDTVFGAFFYRVKAAATAGEKKTRGYPRFKRYQRFSQVMFVAGDGAKWVPSRGRGWAQAAFRRVILVNPAYTSIDCHVCGQRCIRPRRDTVVCPRCGPHDADLNGARNIYARAGLGSGQADMTA